MSSTSTPRRVSNFISRSAVYVLQGLVLVIAVALVELARRSIARGWLK